MTIQSVGAAFVPQDASPVGANNRAIRHDDGGIAASFAGLLASVLFAQPTSPKIAALSQADGTSELDQHVEDANADATGSAGESKHGTDAADPTNPALPATATAIAPTNEIVRSVALLDPALQAKLARVIQRVEQETGHAVSVEETYRSQARQDALYAQGRDTTGPVVTWTHNSKHTQGRAVDVLLDGGAANPDAYQALQRIAREEGLRTLGSRDPGHLELPTPSATNAAASSQLARVAEVAVPAVARTATVAQVAQVAKPGVAAPANASASPQTLGARTGDRDSSNDRGGQTPNDSRNGYAALGATFSSRAHAGPVADAPSIAAPVSTAAERVERVMNAIDSSPARHLSQITMSVDAANGATDRVQVTMRGSSLSSTIDAADPHAAQAMSARSDELVRALNRDGIEVESLRVRAAAERPTTTVAAATAAQTANTSADAQSHSRFDRGDAWQQQQDQQERRQAQQERRDQRERQSRGGNTR